MNFFITKEVLDKLLDGNPNREKLSKKLGISTKSFKEIISYYENLYNIKYTNSYVESKSKRFSGKRYIHLYTDKKKKKKKKIEKKKKKEFKKYNNLENDYSNLSCDGNIYNTNTNYYDKYNSYRKYNDKKIIQFDNKNDKTNENSKDNYSIIFRSNHKNVNKDNHTFYESKHDKMSYRSNYNSHNNYNSCKCSLLRNYSTKRNVMSKDEGIYINNTHNIRNLGDYYMNNNSPRAHSNKRNNYKNTLSSVKTNKQNNSLFTSFLLSNNNTFSFGKSQSLLKNKKIKSSNYYKNNKDNNGRNQIKVVNVNGNKIIIIIIISLYIQIQKIEVA
jgi:hypothetical protein